MVRSTSRPHRNNRKKVTRRKKEVWKTPAANPVIRGAWDKKKTLQQNYVALGLAIDPNGVVAQLDAVQETTQNVLVGEAQIIDGKVVMEEPVSKFAQGRTSAAPAPRPKTAVIEALEDLASRAVSREMTLSEEQFKMLHALRKKHGDDLDKMARDLRRNPYQHTQSQLARLFRHYEAEREPMTARLAGLGVKL